MKRNLFLAILAPCILTVVLIIIIAIDSRDAKKPVPPDNNETEVVGMVTPTGQPEPTTASDPPSAPQVSPSPTQAPAKAPTNTPTQAPSPTPKVTAAPTATPSPMPTPANEQNDEITGTPQNPNDNGEPTDPVQGGSSGTETTDNSGTYIALYTLKEEKYTLIADSITGCYLFIKNNDQSIRQTEFKYAPEYEEVDRWDYGPALGYKNNTFFFMADNQLVASDGETETVLYTFGGAYQRGIAVLNAFAQGENRFLAGSQKTLVVVDSRTLTVETYAHEYSPDFFALSDEVLCFRILRRIPAGPYFNILYSAKGGSIKQLGMIGDIEGHVLEGDTVTIKSYGEMFKINLSTGVLTGPRELEREYTLHLPVYSSGYVEGLSELRYINYNAEGKPVQSIKMPDSWAVQCYYATYYKIPYFYIISDTSKSSLLPAETGRFTVVDTTAFPLVDSKYLDKSSVKEKLYEGQTLLGQGEIFLLERYEPYYDKNNEKIEEAPFEIIYAWIPIQGQTQAYQFYIYVPRGEEKADYLTLMKYFLEAQ